MWSWLRYLRNALAAVATTSGSQVFLGARWVPALLGIVPPARRRGVALWLLSLSPHYFYERDREAESQRCATSREELVRDLLTPYLEPEMSVLDYGCGPGYMVSAVARRVKSVEGVDVSRGALACAQVINNAPNATYESLAECAAQTGAIDLVYSFAVIQHVRDDVAANDLRLLRRRVRDGGTLLVHFPDAQAVPTEIERRLDRSVRGRLRLRFALNLFGRDKHAMQALVSTAGFSDVRFEPLRSKTTSSDDVANDQWLIATARPNAVT